MRTGVNYKWYLVKQRLRTAQKSFFWKYSRILPVQINAVCAVPDARPRKQSLGLVLHWISKIAKVRSEPVPRWKSRDV